MSIRTQSGTIQNTNEVVYTLSETPVGAHRNEGVMVYIDYYKGANETNLDFTPFVKESSLVGTILKEFTVVSATGAVVGEPVAFQNGGLGIVDYINGTTIRVAMINDTDPVNETRVDWNASTYAIADTEVNSAIIDYYNETWMQLSEIVANVLTPQYGRVSASGKYSMKIVCQKNEEQIMIKCIGYNDGVITIEFVEINKGE